VRVPWLGGCPSSGVIHNTCNTYSPLQAAFLLSEFEKRNGRKDCLAQLVFEFGGEFKKAHISRQLKSMGLARGKFTERQVRTGNRSLVHLWTEQAKPL
jgi:hypothetical protein